MAGWVGGALHRLAGLIGRSKAAEWLARGGLVGRGVFYLVLGFLAARVALLHGGSGRQVDAHGALSLVTQNLIGRIAAATAAAGFVAFGVQQLARAWQHTSRASWQRATTALQGAFYLVIAYVPVSFLFGNHQTGSERQQRTRTSQLLGIPGGQVLVVLAGLTVIGVCCWQIRTALGQDYAEDLTMSRSPRWVQAAVRIAGTVGIVARALVFLPVGVLLILAAVQYRPSRARGLDGELLALSSHAWGQGLIGLAAGGLLVFAAYSFLDARYRDVSAHG